MAYDTALADRVRSLLQQRRGFSERGMFGGIAFLIDGHMCCGVTKSDLVLRLAPGDVIAALGRPHTRPMDFTGKPMKSMLYVGAQGTESSRTLQEWVECACAFVRTLPPKPV